MSDSEGGIPSETTISRKLRDVVIAIHKSGKTDDLTLKRVRVRAEKELGLEDGFLKKDSTWKKKSETIIMQAVENDCKQEQPSSPAKPPTPKPAKNATKPKPDASKGVKRKAPEPAKKAKKRRKTDSDEDMDDVSDDAAPTPSEDGSDAPKKPVQRRKNVVAEDSDEEVTPKKPVKKAKNPIVNDSDENADSPAKKASSAKKSAPAKDDLSESEMSELIDESPKKKSRQKKEPAAKAKKTEKTKAAPKPKPAKADDDPDTAEIKRLQGWLVKCGIRKVWSKDPELSACDTSKEKIRVLKGMLKDVGMDGKYSVEKAAKIKEKREFEKDLAAIQEAEAHWGNAGDNGGGRPRRRAAAAAATKPQQKIEFSDDDEEEQEEQDDGDTEDDDDDDDVKGDSGSDDDDKAESMDEDSD